MSCCELGVGWVEEEEEEEEEEVHALFDGGCFLLDLPGDLGGWVGGWVSGWVGYRKVEENEAVRMSCWSLYG